MEAKNITFAYEQQKNILSQFDLTLEKGKITTIVGANGCGKSTLLQILLKRFTPKEGAVWVDGQDIKNQKEFSKSVGAVYQQNSIVDQITVEELVAYGRVPYHKFLKANTELDKEKIQWALEQTNLIDIRQKKMASISGGQRQRAWIALALCQDTEWLLLDEPTTYLDMYYQIEVLELLKKINKVQNKSIVMVLHDINQASTYSDEIIMMKQGRVKYKGNPIDILNQSNIFDIYGVHNEIIQTPYGKMVIPIAKNY